MKLLDKKKIKSIIGFCVFIVIAVSAFLKVTYLFRPTEYDRNHIVGIEEEDVDIVYVGGSAVFVYWQPQKAWNDCGYTSYNFATNTVQAENIKAYIEETQKTQNPELYIVGVRAFQYYSDDQAEAGLRNGTDSMDMTSINRYKLLSDYWSNRNLTDDTDILSYYLDIIKYHTNTGNLASSTAWNFINNNGNSVNNGWEWIDNYGYLEEPTGFATDKRASLAENDQKILTELLEYCKSENLNVLFVVCPYWITQGEQAIYNTIGDTVQKYGFNYLNANEFYEEIGLDWSTDFYNKNHVNLFGAAKYTEFLEKYISENYNITDHRGDELYSSWDDDYERFKREEETHANTVLGLKTDWEKTYEIQEQMCNAASLSEWAQLAEDNRYSLIIAGNGEITWPSNLADIKVLSKWGLQQGDSNYIRVLKGAEVIYSNKEDGNASAEGILGIWNDTRYVASVESVPSKITVADKDYLANPAGLNIVVFDNNYRTVVGHLTLEVNEEGAMEISYIDE